MEKSTLKKELVLNLFITLTIGVLTFCVNKYFANYMGQKELGLMRLFSQLVIFLNLAELGLATASSYSLYKPLLEKKYNKINIIFSTIDSLYKKISYSILIIGIILSFFIPSLINDLEINKYTYLYWYLYVFNVFLSYTFAKYIVLLTANQEYKFVRIIQGVSRIFSQSVQIYILYKTQSFLLFIIASMIDNTIQFILYRIYYKKKYNYIIIVKTREKNIFKNLMNLFWHRISALIVFNTDYIIISKFLSLEIVGIYSSYLIVVNVVNTLLGVLTNIISPKIGLFIANNSKKEIFKLYVSINIIYTYLSIIFCYTTYKTINPFMELWLGKEYLLDNVTIIILILNLFIQLSRTPIEIFKNGFGFFSDIHLAIFESLFNLFFSLFLVRKVGLNGVILGTLLSNIIIIILAKPLLLFKECFKEKEILYLKKLSIVAINAIIIIIILENIFNRYLKNKLCSSWINWIYFAVTIFFVTNIISFIVFIFNSDFRNLIIKKIIKMEKT